MEIGLLDAREWPWLVERSVRTAWGQLTPAQAAAATPAAVAARVLAMLGHGLSRPGSAVLVAREQGVPVGYMVVTVAPDELTGEPYGLFLDIWVEPAWRGRGVAGMLTAAGDAWCRSRGIRLVRRVIATHNGPSLRRSLKDGCVVERLVLQKVLP